MSSANQSKRLITMMFHTTNNCSMAPSDDDACTLHFIVNLSTSSDMFDGNVQITDKTSGIVSSKPMSWPLWKVYGDFVFLYHYGKIGEKELPVEDDTEEENQNSK
uniref:Uncharacterized protein n=1 Tax=Kalanchoe fedtschenkoi TaxID=63787 RepID=A0A7N1A612_KALFE